MRRLIAALGLLSFANLVFVQASGACPLSGGSTHTTESAVPSEPAGHEGHVMSAAQHGAAQQAPSSDAPHGSDCLAMGPCALTLDFSGMMVVSARVDKAQAVIAGSDHLPPSLSTSPELPPPRA